MSKRLEEIEGGDGPIPARYRTLRNTLTAGVIDLDPSGQIVGVNEPFLERTGVSREAIEGERYTAVLGGAAADHLEALVDGSADILEGREGLVWAAVSDGVEMEVETGAEAEIESRAEVTVPTGPEGDRPRNCQCRIHPIIDDGHYHGSVIVLEWGAETDSRHEGVGVGQTEADTRHELERRNRQQSAIATLGERALECDDLDQLMAEVTHSVAETLEADYCKVLDLDDDDRELRLRQGVGWQAGIVGSATVAADENSQAGYTLLSAGPVVVTDLESETRFSGPALLTDHDVTSGISVIIGTLEEPWGILGTHDTDHRQYTDDDVTFIQSLANILATAIERREREQLLERQREQLATLDELNSVVRSIIDTVIEQSTREEIEGAVCTGLANADSYAFAWIGEVDRESQQVRPRAKANTGGYLEEVTISADPDVESGQGPTGRAIRTGQMAVTNDVLEDLRHKPWRESAREYGYQSSAAIPIVHEGATYGVLNVYTERPQAFADREQAVIGQLGEIVGHAIAAIERKRALTSDELVEIELQYRGLFDTVDVPETDDRIRFDQTVPIGGGRYVVYGTTTDNGLETLRAVVEAEPRWETLTVISHAFGDVRFEIRLAKSDVISTVTSHGGSVERAVLEEGDLQMTVRLPQGADVRQLIDALQEHTPGIEPLTRRQVSRSDSSTHQLSNAWVGDLTDRQRESLEAAYFAGFFEWPRERTGEAVAESMDISPATFHQHVRAGKRKLLETLLEGEGEHQDRE